MGTAGKNRLNFVCVSTRLVIGTDFSPPGKPRETPTFNASSAACIASGSRSRSSRRLRKCKRPPRRSCGWTTTNDRAWHSVASHRQRSLRLRLNCSGGARRCGGLPTLGSAGYRRQHRYLLSSNRDCPALPTRIPEAATELVMVKAGEPSHVRLDETTRALWLFCACG